MFQDLKIKYFDEEIDIYNEHNVVNKKTNTIMLDKIPSERGIYVKYKNKELIEVQSNPSQHEFVADRETSTLLFNPIMSGKEVEIDYSAIGKFCMSSNKVYTNVDDKGNIIQTLDELLVENHKILESVKTVGDGATVITQLQANIDSVVGLTGSIAEGSTVNDKLIKTTNTAKATDITLNDTVISANSKLSDLNTWVNNHGNIVDLDNRVESVETSIPEINSQLEHNVRETNEKINNVKSDVETYYAKKDDVAKISSGTPLFASSIDEMHDTTKNYVNTTDGYLYIYSNGSWAKSNIKYQEMGLSDGQVIKSKASFYKKTRNLFDKEKAIYGKYISSTTGELSTPSSEGTFYASDYVEVINGSKYNYRAKDNSYTLYAFYNNDKQFVSGGNSNGTDIVSPVDGFIRVSVWKNVDVDTVQFELGDATEYIEPYILEVEEEVANIKPKIEKVLENQVDYSDCNRNKFNPNIAIINKQVSPSNGSIIDVTTEGTFYASEMINVKGHEKINCIKNDFTTMYSTYAFYDVNGGFVSGGSGEINGVDIPSNATGFKFTVWKNILPENIMIELDGLNSFIRFDDDSRNQEVYLTKMKFKDIIINCIGDSITYGFLTSDTRMQSPYPSSLKSLLGAKEVRNYGLSGTTIANDRTVMGSYEPMSSPTRVVTWDNNADVITILGGVNDFIKNVELGTIDDEVDTTFYGGYKSLIKQLYKKYPNKKIIIMTPLHYNLEYTSNSKGYILKDYVNAIREIAEMFGIYLIDLYAICDININTRGKYQVDGLHTNQFYVSNIMTPLIADGLNRAIQ